MGIRKATDADRENIFSLVRQYPDVLVQDHLPEPEEFFVAEEGGQIVGCCALEVYSKRLAEIRSLAVIKKHQGEGIGTALIEHCLQEAETKGTVPGVASGYESDHYASDDRALIPPCCKNGASPPGTFNGQTFSTYPRQHH